MVSFGMGCVGMVWSPLKCKAIVMLILMPFETKLQGKLPENHKNTSVVTTILTIPHTDPSLTTDTGDCNNILF